MYSVIQETAEHPALRSLAQAALTAQLKLLALFLPAVAVWRIGPSPGNGASPLATIAPEPDALAAYLDTLADDTARGKSEGGMFHRAVTAEEARRWPELRTREINDVYVHALAAGGEAAYFLVGLAKTPPPEGPPALLEQVRLCIDVLSASLAMYARMTSSERMIREMQRDVFIDPLTGVLNRAGWVHGLRSLEAIPMDEDIAIVILDLDMLKHINDTQGHGAGDLLLQKTAHTLNGALRSTDIVARLGGDEFAIALRNATPVGAELIAQRLNQQLSAVGIQVSIGLALRSDVQGSLTEAIAMADARMYSNKRTRATVEQLSIFVRGLGG
ncbi:MAG: GGDEF domain-containing protein [Candidimonas sp.]|jgi:diguanylate cyclase (GGDEF)-like protein